MSTMTKKYTVTHNKIVFGDTLVSATKNQKIAEMVNLGKMDSRSTAVHKSQFDGTTDTVISIVGIRSFVDQAAAEEYRDFSIALSNDHDLGLVSVVIEDI